jgi:hypothetical protein
MGPFTKLSRGETKGSITGNFYLPKNGKYNGHAVTFEVRNEPCPAEAAAGAAFNLRGMEECDLARLASFACYLYQSIENN